MDVKTEIKRLMDNPLKPNASEWAMDAEDVLSEINMLTDESKKAIKDIKFFNGQGVGASKVDVLVVFLKRAYNKIAPSIAPPPIKSRHQVFVAMRFDNERERLYKDILTPTVQAANYSIIKVNDQEYEGSIIGKIVDDITDSTILIADLTGNRGGVYYELGIAKGLQLCNHPIRTILTCDKKFFDDEKVHFDVQGDNIILYESDDDYKEKLSRRIQAYKDEMNG